MSSVVISTSAATGRLFVFDEAADAESRVLSDGKKPASTESEIAQVIQSAIANRKSAIAIAPASRLTLRPAPEMAPSGIAALDALTGGLPRGCLTELCGPASSGRTSIMLATLATATRRGEFCAVVDAADSLDPQSVVASGVELDHLLWVRCGEASLKNDSRQRHPSTALRAGSGAGKRDRGQESPGGEKVGKGTASAVPSKSATNAALAAGGQQHSLQKTFFQQARINPTHPDSQNKKYSEHRLEQALRSTDLLLESGGFGLIVLDFADLPPQVARRIPLTTWFRFRRAVENKPTILLAIEQQAIAGSCSSLLLQLKSSTQYSVPGTQFSGSTIVPAPSHSHLLTGSEIETELVRSLDRKPARSVTFATRAAWAG